MKKLNFIDLFAGAGGLSEGFIRSGFEPIAHVEIDKAACYTLKTRTAYHYLTSVGKKDTYLKYLKGDISREDLYKEIPSELLNSVINAPIGSDQNDDIQSRIDVLLKNRSVDLIIGGPPCQAYSLAGRSRSATKMKGDPRNYLYVEYAKYLEKYTPKYFVFENVVGLKSAGKGVYLNNMRNLFFKKGYEIELFVVQANDFGVLQNRRRVIIIGKRIDLKSAMPQIDKLKFKHSYTVSDLLSDLPVIKSGGGRNKALSYTSQRTDYLEKSMIRNGIDILTQHVSRPNNDQDKEIYRIAVSKWNKDKERLRYNELPERLKSHKNEESFLDRFKVVSADSSFSHTVVAHIAKDGHYYIHPDLDQNRSISIREAARLQSFPDDYYFEGVREGVNRTPAYKQIGNAVPPLMAYEISKIIKETLCQTKLS